MEKEEYELVIDVGILVYSQESEWEKRRTGFQPDTSFISVHYTSPE